MELVPYSAADQDLTLALESDPVVMAEPGAANGASNALCRRSGFTWTEECQVDYAGRTLRCNHWELRVT